MGFSVNSSKFYHAAQFVSKDGKSPYAAVNICPLASGGVLIQAANNNEAIRILDKQGEADKPYCIIPTKYLITASRLKDNSVVGFDGTTVTVFGRKPYIDANCMVREAELNLGAVFALWSEATRGLHSETLLPNSWRSHEKLPARSFEVYQGGDPESAIFLRYTGLNDYLGVYMPMRVVMDGPESKPIGPDEALYK